MLKIFFLALLTLSPLRIKAETLKDNPILSSLAGSWLLLETNYYLGEKLTNFKGHLNISYRIVLEGDTMIWRSSQGIVKTFFFDYETKNKTVKTPEYEDQVNARLEGESLIHEANRKYFGQQKIMKVRNTFELKNNGKTMHHIFEDLNGPEIYKVHAIYSRDVKSIIPVSLATDSPASPQKPVSTNGKK